jgi:GDPmannose 4,6-dehydratase
MLLMLQQSEPGDYVIATGEGHTVRDFVQAAFAAVGIAEWQGYVRSVPEFWRAEPLIPLVGNPAKAERVLNWQRQYSFHNLVETMVAADLARHVGLD